MVERVVDDQTPAITARRQRLVWHLTDIADQHVTLAIGAAPAKGMTGKELLLGGNAERLKEHHLQLANSVAVIIHRLGLLDDALNIHPADLQLNGGLCPR